MKDKKEHKQKHKDKHKHKKSKKELKHKKSKKEKHDLNETKLNKISPMEPSLTKESTAKQSHTISHSKIPLEKVTALQTPTLKTTNYSSASDSDSTDNDNQSPPRRSILNKPTLTTISTPSSKLINSAKLSAKRPLSDSDSDSTDTEAKTRPKPLTVKQPEPPISRSKPTSAKSADKQNPVSKTKSYTSASDSDSTDDDKPSPPRRSILSKPTLTARSTPSSKPIKSDKLSTKRPLSDSDSDSTDNEAKTRSKPLIAKQPEPPISRSKPTSAKSADKRTPVPKTKSYASASDSDSTDDDKPSPPRRSILKKPALKTGTTSSSKPIKPAKSSTKRPITSGSDSGSDSTDNEAQRKSKPLPDKRPEFTSTSRFRLPNGAGAHKNVSAPRTEMYIEEDDEDDDDDDDDSGSSTHTKQYQSNAADIASRLIDRRSGDDSSDDDNSMTVEAKFRARKIIQRKTGLGEFSNNRLQWQRMYRNKNGGATEYMRRYVDEADKINVHHDFFISDSDSESDSNDDYSDPPLPWHNGILNGSLLKKALATKNWNLKTGRFSRAEDIRLEKRVKKICRREEIDLDGFREKIREDAGHNKLFWQKIAKVMPDRSLNMIVESCRRKYNEYAYKNAPWTEKMDRELVEYLKIYGRDFDKLQNLMGRPRTEIRARITELLRPEDVPSQKQIAWTDEQTQEFLDLAKTEKCKKSWSTWTNFAKTHYDGKRTGYQCKMKWQSRNANKPVTISTKLGFIRALAKQKHQKETEFDMSLVSDEVGYHRQQIKAFYLKARSTIPDFEKKNVPDILAILDKRFAEMERSIED